VKWIKLYEEFQDSKVSIEDIIDCIEKGGQIYSDIVKEYPKNDPNEPLTPLSIDDDGIIAVEIDGRNYEIDIKDVKKIDY
jgi:hypothetical protein